MNRLLFIPLVLVSAGCQRSLPPDERPSPPTPQSTIATTPSPIPSPTATPVTETIDRELESELAEIVKSVDGRVGVGVQIIQTGETALLDRHGRYPMLSVHKLPIAMAVLKMVDDGRIRLDQEVSISPEDFVRPGYNSPLRNQHPHGVVLPLRDIVRASVSESDGTASDVLLELARGPGSVQKYLDALGLGDAMVITDSEKTMSEAWENQYHNWATPDATIRLLRMLQERRAGLSEQTTQVLFDVMRDSETGERRITGGLPEGTPFAHKTGTGGTEKGITSATNDVGIITLPDGRHVAIAVYIRDSKSPTSVRLEAMRKIAEAVWKRWVGEARPS